MTETIETADDPNEGRRIASFEIDEYQTYANWCRQHGQEPEQPNVSVMMAFRFMKDMIRDADAALSWRGPKKGKTPEIEEEQAQIREAKDDLEFAFNEIGKVIATVPAQSDREHAYSNLWALMGAIFVIQSRGALSHSARAAALSGQSGRSRQGKSQQDNLRQQQLRWAILAVSARDKLREGDAYAESIKDQVRTKLSVTGKWPTTRTIARHISDILKA